MHSDLTQNQFDNLPAASQGTNIAVGQAVGAYYGLEYHKFRTAVSYAFGGKSWI
jgi:hypothetical protein